MLPDTVRAFHVKTAEAGAFSGWVDEQGRIVQAAQPGGFVLRRMPYELAFSNWRLAGAAAAVTSSDRDILETTAIAADDRVTRELVRLVVRLREVDLAGFDLAGGRQGLRGDTLTITREGETALRAAYRLDGSSRRRFPRETAPEPLVESGHPLIAGLAMRIAGRETDPARLSERLVHWVHDSLTKRTTFGIPSALQVARARSGDCNEHAQLYVALARALGIPARVAAGLAYVNGKFYYHAWPEVFLNGWVAVDPTFRQFPADAAHLRFVNGGLARQTELLRLIGTLDVDVVAAR